VLVESPHTRIKYKCTACGNDDFREESHILQRFCSEQSSSSLKSLESTYRNLCCICFSDSWYVHESGERLLQSLLDLLGEQEPNTAEQQQFASRALAIVQELLVVPNTTDSTENSASHVLRRNILTYKAAKVRLFLQPDPRQAISELQSVLQSLSIYFPKNHEIIVGLQECLMQAMV
jgi:hypothetical protein